MQFLLILLDCWYIRYWQICEILADQCSNGPSRAEGPILCL